MRRSGSETGAAGRFFEAVTFLEKVIANSAYVIILATICWNVLSRYVVPTPAAWAEDVTSIAFAWLIFVGAAAAHNKRAHISVDLLTMVLPKPAQRVLAKAVEVFMLVFCTYATYLCAQQTYVSHFKAKTIVLHIPLSVLFAGVTLGFALMALRSAQHLMERQAPPGRG